MRRIEEMKDLGDSLDSKSIKSKNDSGRDETTCSEIFKKPWTKRKVRIMEKNCSCNVDDGILKNVNSGLATGTQ